MNIRIYDNGGETFDRYTVIYMDDLCPYTSLYTARGMSENPSHPQGFGQICEAEPGEHLGKEIDFTDLPEPCQRMVLSDLSYAN